MKAQQRRTRFDTRSVMLFAALSLGGAAALQAQAQTSAPSPQFGPGEKSAPLASPKYSLGPASNTSPAAPSTAFDRADANKDGQLSAKEAAQLPAIGQRFKELDTDQSGTLSRQEFDKGTKS
jgi:type II secretory pathway component HofQ